MLNVFNINEMGGSMLRKFWISRKKANLFALQTFDSIALTLYMNFNSPEKILKWF